MYLDLHVITNQIAVLFLLMALGFVVGKAKILSENGNKVISKIVVNIAMPCLMLSAVFESEAGITFGDTMLFILFSFLTLGITFAVSIPVMRLFGGNKADRGLLNFMSIFSNSGFMGFPVIIAIFGISAAYYVAMFHIPFNALIFTVGILMISGKKNQSAKQHSKKINPKLLLSPAFIVSLISIPIALIGINPPYIVAEAARITGSITTPGAMIVIGSTFAYIPLKNIFSEWRIIPMTILRLIIIPILTWLILKQIITNDLVLGVLVVISAMPSASMASLLAIEYGGNEKIATAGVFVTTLLCGITVPLIVRFLLL